MRPRVQASAQARGVLLECLPTTRLAPARITAPVTLPAAWRALRQLSEGKRSGRFRLELRDDAARGGLAWAGQRRLEVFVGDVRELLPVRGLIVRDAKIAERLLSRWITCRSGRQAILLAFAITAAFRLLHRLEEPAGLALGPQPDLARAAFGLGVLRQAGVVFQRDRLVADVGKFSVRV
jgi:hypothetical protein